MKCEQSDQEWSGVIESDKMLSLSISKAASG